MQEIPNKAINSSFSVWTCIWWKLVGTQRVVHSTFKSVRILNLHKAYNIRVGLFVESLVSNPSAQARPRKQGKEGKRRTVSVPNNKQRKVRGCSKRITRVTEKQFRWGGNKRFNTIQCQCSTLLQTNRLRVVYVFLSTTGCFGAWLWRGWKAWHLLSVVCIPSSSPASCLFPRH